MAWEPDKQVRKLLIEDLGKKDGQNRFRVSPFMRVERGNGEVYMEPLPALTCPSRLSTIYDFAAIEIVPPAAANHAETGLNQLTVMFSDHGDLGGNPKAGVGLLGIGTA